MPFVRTPPLENQAFAAVRDNVGTAVIEQSVGSWEDSKDAHSIFGLLRLIIEMLSAQMEKLAFLNENVDVRMDAMEAKIDLQTATLQENIEQVGQMASASYNLFVYLPKADALSDYTGRSITITSESGNQTASTVLKDTGTNYSGTIYFNFSGNCKLAWTAVNELGEEFDITENINIVSASQVFLLCSDATRLRVFFPCNIALSEYENELIVLETDDRVFESKLKTKGNNYEAVFYTDFTGTANLKYNFLDEQGVSVGIDEPLTRSAGKMDLEIGLNSMDPGQMSWRTINTILKSGRTELFGLTTEGTTLPDGWIVVGTGIDNTGNLALQLWRKASLGNMDWSSANSTAINYWKTFNEQFFNMTFKSSLLSKSELESGWLAKNRSIGISYWTSTLDGSRHVTVGSVSGQFGAPSAGDSALQECIPCVWIH